MYRSRLIEIFILVGTFGCNENYRFDPGRQSVPPHESGDGSTDSTASLNVIPYFPEPQGIVKTSLPPVNWAEGMQVRRLDAILETIARANALQSPLAEVIASGIIAKDMASDLGVTPTRIQSRPLVDADDALSVSVCPFACDSRIAALVFVVERAGTGASVRNLRQWIRDGDGESITGHRVIKMVLLTHSGGVCASEADWRTLYSDVVAP